MTSSPSTPVPTSPGLDWPWNPSLSPPRHGVTTPVPMSPGLDWPWNPSMSPPRLPVTPQRTLPPRRSLSSHSRSRPRNRRSSRSRSRPRSNSRSRSRSRSLSNSRSRTRPRSILESKEEEYEEEEKTTLLTDEELARIAVQRSAMTRTVLNAPSQRKRNVNIYEQRVGTVNIASNAHAGVLHDFLPVDFANDLFTHLTSLDVYTSPIFRIYGKDIPIPRGQVAYGSRPYTYSGIVVTPRPWSEQPLLLKTKEIVQHLSGEEFDYVLVNMYNGGSNYISWHADDEADIALGSTIASVSLGQARRFLLRRKYSKGEKPTQVSEFPATHNVLLTMGGLNFQRDFKHSVPKQPRATGQRINLTFRKLRSE
jgi:alkylated DNA repair dioxygenase AlkB